VTRRKIGQRGGELSIRGALVRLNPRGVTARRPPTPEHNNERSQAMASTTGAAPGSTESFLRPIEKPKGLFLKMGYAYSRREFGKVFSPLSVFCARMPSAFTRFYGKVGSLDKKLQIPQDTVKLLREQVASINGCLYCMDSNRFAALEKADNDLSALVQALPEYRTSSLFSPQLTAALDYATELARDKIVSPATFAALSAHYTERQICDIVWVVASEHLYNINNIGLNIGSDGLCEAKR
jgi:alkylhydroperoxidase family enzyme